MCEEKRLITISDELAYILENDSAEITDICEERNGGNTAYVTVCGKMDNYELWISFDGTERDFVCGLIDELGGFDAAADAVDKINLNGCITETDDIRWFADAADELETLVSRLKADMDAYAVQQGWRMN